MGPDEDIKLAADFNKANPHYGQQGEGTKTWPGQSGRSAVAPPGAGTRTIRS